MASSELGVYRRRSGGKGAWTPAPHPLLLIHSDVICAVQFIFLLYIDILFTFI
jgi:hypothetical protein